jgi:hypothetical protein
MWLLWHRRRRRWWPAISLSLSCVIWTSSKIKLSSKADLLLSNESAWAKTPEISRSLMYFCLHSDDNGRNPPSRSNYISHKIAPSLSHLKIFAHRKSNAFWWSYLQAHNGALHAQSNISTTVAFDFAQTIEYECWAFKLSRQFRPW